MDNEIVAGVEIIFSAEDLSEPVAFEAQSVGQTGTISSVENGEGKFTVRGTGIVYNQISKPWKVPTTGQTVQFSFSPGSANPAPDVLALYQHQRGQLLGRTSSGTMRLIPHETGVNFELDLPDTSLGRDVRVLMERGDLSASSVRMTGAKGVPQLNVPGASYPVVFVSSFSYPEISIVDNPGFANATAGLSDNSANVDNSLTPSSESVIQNISEKKKDYAIELAKLKLAESKRQSIARSMPKRIYK